MKKLLYFMFVLASAAIIGSCGGAAKDGESVDSDSIRIADSLAEMMRRDSIEWASFTSKDLTFFGLHGHVKAMVRNGTTFEFDTLGNWTKIGNVSPYGRKIDFYDYYSVYSHDANGFITHEEFWEGGTEYIWKDGRIVGENSFNCAYECRLSYDYDTLGNVSKMTMVESDDAGETWSKPTKIDIKYINFDELGNWTLRKSNNGSDYRFIVYYDQPSINKNAGFKDQSSTEFNPWQHKYILKGSIGKEKECPFTIGPKGGVYSIELGTRNNEVTAWDSKTGQLTMSALKFSDGQKLGEFQGTVTSETGGKFRYKGTFTNEKGGKVNFNLLSI
ncbi:MAG: hypothetical protein J5678_03170 [Bacteroidaceae bacterium]|nr:hypothetical protein [Bacteroidaceae bacterium]